MLQRLSYSLIVPARLVFFMWAIFFLEVSWNVDLSFLGIMPRELAGLPGIVVSPLLHGSLWHLSSNSIPLLLLGTTVYFFYPRIAGQVFFHAYFISGALVWLLARPFIHIGASGLVYGLAFFLFFFGFFKKSMRSLLVSTVILLAYGSLFIGVFPGGKMISWESHLSGALVGFGTAFYYGKSRYRIY